MTDALPPGALRTFYRASAHYTAKLRTRDADDFDDLVQEGVVAAWQATRREERTDPATYGAVSARRRITSMLTGRYPMVGNEAEPGKRTFDLARQAPRREDFAATADLMQSGDPFVAVEQRVDLERALLVLEPRDRVMARMVGLDQPWEAIGPTIGLAPLGARNRWNRQVRPVLREALTAAA